MVINYYNFIVKLHCLRSLRRVCDPAVWWDYFNLSTTELDFLL